MRPARPSYSGPAGGLKAPLRSATHRRARRSTARHTPVASAGNGGDKNDWDAAWRDLKKNLPAVEPASGARPASRNIRPLDSRAARQAAARAGTPPAPKFVKGGGSPQRSTGDPALDAIRAQERVNLDIWSDARFAAAGGALAAGLLVAFLVQGPP